MPADDYTAAVSGGLKLKNVSSSPKVSKSHKKKRPKSSQPESSISANAEISKDGAKNDGGDATIDRDDGMIEKSGQLLENGEATSPPRAGKTEAELRHEERRRKRVCYFHTLAYPAIYTRVLAKQCGFSSTSGSSAKAPRRTKSVWKN